MSYYYTNGASSTTTYNYSYSNNYVCGNHTTKSEIQKLNGVASIVAKLLPFVNYKGSLFERADAMVKETELIDLLMDLGFIPREEEKEELEDHIEAELFEV